MPSIRAEILKSGGQIPDALGPMSKHQLKAAKGALRTLNAQRKTAKKQAEKVEGARPKDAPVEAQTVPPKTAAAKMSAWQAAAEDTLQTNAAPTQAAQPVAAYTRAPAASPARAQRPPMGMTRPGTILPRSPITGMQVTASDTQPSNFLGLRPGRLGGEQPLPAQVLGGISRSSQVQGTTMLSIRPGPIQPGSPTPVAPIGSRQVGSRSPNTIVRLGLREGRIEIPQAASASEVVKISSASETAKAPSFHQTVKTPAASQPSRSFLSRLTGSVGSAWKALSRTVSNAFSRLFGLFTREFTSQA